MCDAHSMLLHFCFFRFAIKLKKICLNSNVLFILLFYFICMLLSLITAYYSLFLCWRMFCFILAWCFLLLCYVLLCFVFNLAVCFALLLLFMHVFNVSHESCYYLLELYYSLVSNCRICDWYCFADVNTKHMMNFHYYSFGCLLFKA